MSTILKLVWVQRRKVTCIFLVLFLFFVAVTFVFAASSQELPGGDLCRRNHDEHDCIVEAFPMVTDNLMHDPVIALATTRIITATIQSFTSLRVSIIRMEDYPLGIGTPFTYRLSVLVEQGATVSNVTVTPTGGGTCSLLPNMDISCSGVLTRLVISYQYSYTPILHPPYVVLGVGGSDTTSVDYTVNVFYPSTFTFMESTPPPDSHILPTRSLVWTKNNTFEFRPEIRFQALELYGSWLPLIRR